MPLRLAAALFCTATRLVLPLAQHHPQWRRWRIALRRTLIGFGSPAAEIAYRFEDHVRYLDAFIARRKSRRPHLHLVAAGLGTALASIWPHAAPNCARNSLSWNSSGR